MVERLQEFMETSFEPGRSFANELDFQDQLDRWFDERANVRLHRTLRERPVDRLARERESMRALPEPGAGSRPADGDAGAAAAVRARRSQRLLAGPVSGRPAGGGARLAA